MNKKVAIIIAVVLLIVIIGIVAYFMMSKPASPAPAVVSKPASTAPAVVSKPASTASPAPAPTQAPMSNVNSTVTGGRKPCDIYNDSSVGISQDCYRQLWREVGCGGDPFLIPDKANWNSDKNLATLKGDVKTWYEYANNRNSSYHKQFCKAAGEPFSFNTPQYLRHLQNKMFLLY